MPHSLRSDSDRTDYRCQRCWSERDINLHPKSEFMGNQAKGFVILCERCRGEAPRGEDKENAFEDLFLKFASPKEFMQHFEAKNEAEAYDRWRENRGRDVGFHVVRDEEPNAEGIDEVREDACAPFGYMLEDNMLKIVNDDSEVVRNIFERYRSGQTMESIARALSKEREGKGEDLNVGTVRKILKNPIYAGYEFKGGDVKKAEHPPIVHTDLFNSVQERIQRNIRNPRYRAEPLILGH